MAADNEELTQLVGKELSRGKGTLWCEVASHTNECRVDSCVNSGEEDLTDDQEEEIQLKKKKTTSLAEEKHERVQRLVDELKAKHGVQFSGPQCRLWAESIDVNQHDSMDTSPLGTTYVLETGQFRTWWAQGVSHCSCFCSAGYS